MESIIVYLNNELMIDDQSKKWYCIAVTARVYQFHFTTVAALFHYVVLLGMVVIWFYDKHPRMTYLQL
jgi:hypothetical protein